MGIESTYEIHQNAYIKLILHASKHKTSAVNGVLLGRISGDSAVVEIVESVPLFHSQIGVLPPLEIALIMLDNKKFETLSKEGKDRSPVMQLYTKDASRSWKLVGSDGSSRLKIKQPSANVILLDYISSGKWKDIIDFDDHLDDISKDWVNTELFN
uniref:Neighbor of COX4 n=1 Tax=Solanum tuberosum TaxID=4113 RepID=M1AGM7_SOLTU